MLKRWHKPPSSKPIGPRNAVEGQVTRISVQCPARQGGHCTEMYLGSGWSRIVGQWVLTKAH